MPSHTELSVIKAVVTVLKPLSLSTDALSGETIVTVSAIHPLLDHILNNVVAPSENDCILLKELKRQ